MQFGENCVGVDLQNLIRTFARIEGKQDGDQPADDMGVAFAKEMEVRGAVAAIDRGCEPNLADAALNLVGGVACVFREWLKGTAKLDDIAIAVLPIVEKLEIGKDRLEAYGRIGTARRCGLSLVHDANISTIGEDCDC